MTTSIELPTDLLPLAGMIQASMRENGTRSGGAPASLDTIMDVLIAVRAVQSGPRWVAEFDGTHDSLGNPGYYLRDTRTGRVESTYEGYFAGQDARSAARYRNGEEE